MITLTPHQKQQLTRPTKLTSNKETYGEYFSLKSFDDSIENIILTQFEHSVMSRIEVKEHHLISRYNLIQALDGDHRVSYASSDNYTIPKSISPYILNELEVYLKSPMFAEMKVLALESLEKLNNSSLADINLLKAEKNLIETTLETKKAEIIKDFKAEMLDEVESYEDFVNINKSYVVRHNEVRDLKRKIEALDEKITDINDRVALRLTDKRYNYLVDAPSSTILSPNTFNNKYIYISGETIMEMLRNQEDLIIAVEELKEEKEAV